MTKKGYLMLTPIILVGSFLFSMLQSENILWPIAAGTFHFLLFFTRCFIQRYLRKRSRLLQRPQWMRIYVKATLLLPLCITLGLIGGLHFFVEDLNLLRFFDFVAHSNVGPSVFGILFGFISGTIYSYKMDHGKIQKLLFVKEEIREVNYHIHEFVTS